MIRSESISIYPAANAEYFGLGYWASYTSLQGAEPEAGRFWKLPTRTVTFDNDGESKTVTFTKDL